MSNNGKDWFCMVAASISTKHNFKNYSCGTAFTLRHERPENVFWGCPFKIWSEYKIVYISPKL